MKLTNLVFILVVIFNDIQECYTYTSYDMNEVCSSTITLHETENGGGELHLDSDQMSRSLMPNGKCQVVIQSQGTDSKHTDYVLFYFTKFSVGLNDPATNVSIQGQLNTKRTRMPLLDLPDDLNGYNKSLLDPVAFFEVAESILVTYQTSFYWRDFSEFTLHFIFLSEGNCKERSLEECINGRCVTHDLFCNDTVYACGSTNNECLDTEALLNDVWESIKGSLENVGVYILIGVAGFICFTCIRSNARRHGGITNIPVIRRILHSTGSRSSGANNELQMESSHDPNNTSVASPDNVEVTERASLSAHEETSDPFSPPNYETVISNTHENLDNSFTSASSSILTQPDIPTTTVHDDYPQPSAPPIGDNYPPPADTFPPPPPSYSEVMSDETKYIK